MDGVSLNVMPGECVGLIGPNGAGKSTVLDNISGFNLKHRGRVHMFGTDVSSWPMQKRARLGVARSFQAPRMFGRMTVLSNLMVAPQRQPGESVLRVLAGGWRNAEQRHLDRARHFIQRFALNPVVDNYASDLSGGQERLVELARSLMTGPHLLLLDEPFAGVSPVNRRRLVEHLQHLSRDEGIAILMVEHRLEWVQQLCSRVLVMALGRIIAEGSLDEVAAMSSVVDAYLGRRK